jgi:hypothetical protein
LLAGLSSFAWGYINGGDFHSTLKDYEKKLKQSGWGVSTGFNLPEDCDRTREVTKGVTVAPLDNAEYQKYVNELIGKAIQSLPEKHGARVGVEDKREVARQARKAIATAVTNKKQELMQGEVGSLRYEVGIFAFESYWETNYNKKREIHARREGFVPLIALKVVDPK